MRGNHGVSAVLLASERLRSWRRRSQGFGRCHFEVTPVGGRGRRKEIRPHPVGRGQTQLQGSQGRAWLGLCWVRSKMGGHGGSKGSTGLGFSCLEGLGNLVDSLHFPTELGVT